MLTMKFSFLFIGVGVAILLELYRASKHAGQPPDFVIEDHDGDVFVYGAHA